MKRGYWGVGALVFCLVLAGCGSNRASLGTDSIGPAGSASTGGIPTGGASTGGSPNSGESPGGSSSGSPSAGGSPSGGGSPNGSGPPAGAVVTNNVVSLSAKGQTNVPVTFGQVFKDGDVAKGKTLTATLAGKRVPLQVDVKATNPDGSLRHAVLTALVPSLAGKAIEPLAISSASYSPSGAPVMLAQLLATQYDATASLKIGGTAYTVDARALLQAANSASACKPWGKQCNVWLSGALVSEWIVGGPVKDAQGKANPNLQVYFDVRAYAGTSPGSIAYVRTDIVVENTWAYTTAAVVKYTATLASGSANYTSPALTQYNDTRWHQTLWWNGAQPSVYLQQNTQYIQATGAVPRYEQLTPDQNFLAGLAQSCAPLATCDQTPSMGDPGAQDPIGPFPRWTSVYLIDPDVRAYNWMLANTDALGAYSIHLRDNATGYAVSIVRHPYANTDTVSANPEDASSSTWGHDYRMSLQDTATGRAYKADLLPLPCLAAHTCTNETAFGIGNPDSWDNAHQPAEGYVPYMVTGSYYYEQEVAFGASQNELWTSAAARGFSKGLIVPDGHAQVRGVAWSLREMVDAAYILPDASPLKMEFNNDVKNSIESLNATFTNNPKASPLHSIESLAIVKSNHGGMSNWEQPWEEDFMVWSANHAAELGFQGADAFRDWLATYQIGRATNPGFCWLMASHYDLIESDSSGHWLNSLADVYKATFPTLVGLKCNSPEMVAAVAKLENAPWQAGEMWGYPQSATGYPANYQIGLAAAADSGLPNAKKAWEIFQNRSVQPKAPTAYNDFPNFALLPRYLPAGPIVNIYADSNPVSRGGKVNLYWRASDAKSCSAKWTSSTATSGEFRTAALSAATAFPITCTGADGSAQASVTVTVAGQAVASGANGKTPPPTSSGGSGGPSTSPSSGTPANGSASPAGFAPAGWQPEDSNPPKGVPPGPTNAAGALSAGCATLKTCTLSVETKGPFQDISQAKETWSSAEYARVSFDNAYHNCILFTFGDTTNGPQDNSVRCFDPATNQFSFVLQDTETGSTGTTVKVTGNGLIARDNMLMLNIPGKGLLLAFGAYETKENADNYWNGFLDYGLGKWTYRNNVYGLFVPPTGFFTWNSNENRWNPHIGVMNPATAWSQQDDVGFIYGGDSGGSPSAYLVLVHPRKDGRFDLESVAAAGTLSCTNMRNDAVAVGDWVYVVGGRCIGDTTASDGPNEETSVHDTRMFRRFNLITHQWQTLAPLPAPRAYPSVTYDSRSGYIVVYGGNGGFRPNGSNDNKYVTHSDPGYWARHNTVYIWNVNSAQPAQEQWMDVTRLVNSPLPIMGMPNGAYDPTTGWNCYRPGLLFDANGVAAGVRDKAQVWCMRLDFGAKK